ncbi:inositol monophosphatase family protein [Yimella sp. cx-51]|uniref:inositol monophosphatase family protein n=1 Tax=Yimella sp. cx-51 TaxID=2770551 RepID=UPI00165E51E3|nr:inositol monophosphatase family protein [Yimella sp. cx-51]MBC9957651.1 inositol monophosphatase [Yimella sp. cx-51]MBD2758692.1 inositol monophosphatase [Yimella sp. cx-573]QTH36993.1 inositol monophosphatase [Yimella sp. cx-51]
MADDLTDFATLETIARDLALAAGRLIVDERPVGLGVAATKSSATDVVTEMDRRSEQLLQDELTRRRPDDGLLGEEGASTVGTSGITWVVDPIDGTVNYLYQLPAYAVSVAACTGDPSQPELLEPVAGAVYNPITGELFHGHRGGGAHLSIREVTQSLRASQEGDLSLALLGTGFGYEAQIRRRQGALLAELIGDVRDVRRGGSAALDLCSVAAGRLDVYYESGLNPWDRAAGQLLVQEAGGVVRIEDEQPGRLMVIAGSPALVDELAPRVTTR